ncbi:dynactin P62 subunit [Culex quinquefasciatus]|uniref:Dynactin P62 subunit n=1 Tax=Culex quinquefasciatus TaxID=7176 RepID=B0XDS5_CULQU|nr:dynactin P62 subunit [Culex quinquefasciatus]|eukprot:XP_001867797.1 dynactin P62 subunit [Culex quinquefasciatus]
MIMLHSVFWAKIRPEVGVVKGHIRRVLDDNPNLATDSAGWKIPTSNKLNPMGVRKRHAEEEQLLVAKRTNAGVVHEEGKHDESDLHCDWGNIAILFFLYLLQGIPIGLAVAIPMMLQNRSASYKQQLVQYLIGLFMLILSLHVNRLGNSEGDEVVSYIAPNIPILTGIFFALNFLAATQDIAVDERALTMLKRCNLGQSHPLPNRPNAARRGRRLVHPAMIYDHHVPYYFYPIRCGAGGNGRSWSTYATRFGQLLQSSRLCFMKSRSRWRRKTQNTSKFLSLTDRTGLTMGWTKQIKATPSLINRSIVSEAVDELPENLLTKPIQQKNITTRQQRLAQPAKKPFTMKKPYPQDKLVSIKRSLRCRKCDHNPLCSLKL